MKGNTSPLHTSSLSHAEHCYHACQGTVASDHAWLLTVQAFQTAEELEAEDSWFCSKCKRHVQANKKLDLWAVPEVLVVHLKRFFFTRARRDKLDVQVEFPLENWDLSSVLPRQQVPICQKIVGERGLKRAHQVLKVYFRN